VDNLELDVYLFLKLPIWSLMNISYWSGNYLELDVYLLLERSIWSLLHIYFWDSQSSVTYYFVGAVDEAGD